METRGIETSASVVESVLARAASERRTQLFEYEACELVEAFTGCAPPAHVFVARGESPTSATLAGLRSARVVLKVVSPDIVHKTEARGVVFVPNELDAVRAGIAELERRLGARADVRGVLVVEALERPARVFGDELFVGLRATREFGPVLAAGLGGVDTEYFAERMQRGGAIAKAVALDVSAERFFELFARTAAYDALAGRMRGRERLVGDDELVRCFAGFLELARAAFVARDEARIGAHGSAPALVELEVNPFAVRDGRLTPLDARGRLGAAVREPAPRPQAQLARLFEPRAIAVLGVSATAKNFGRIILDNVLECGFPREHVFVIKPGSQELCGVRCVPSIEALPERVDLVVLAAAAAQLPDLVRSCVASGRVESAILVPGGVGEIQGRASSRSASAPRSRQLARSIAAWNTTRSAIHTKSGRVRRRAPRQRVADPFSSGRTASAYSRAPVATTRSSSRARRSTKAGAVRRAASRCSRSQARSSSVG